MDILDINTKNCNLMILIRHWVMLKS